MNLLTIRNLSKTYPGQFQPAVSKVTLTLRKGEILGIIGESGSGKTTLLRIIAGLEDADNGTIRLNGKPVAGPAQTLVPGHPHIRLVHQDFKLAPNISIRENITYSLRMYEPDYRQERLDAMIRLCDLETLQHKLPRQLSGGEMQRVALARALADEPALLLLDEPFSNVDTIRRQELKHEISDIIRQSGTTAIFVTHDTSEALTLSDKVSIMQQGQIIQTGTPQQVYEKPATPYVAVFFGYANLTTAGALLQSSLQPEKMSRFQATSQLCIRAENIYIGADDTADFRAVVRKINYMGMYSIAEVEITPALRWQVFVPAAILFPQNVFLRIDWERVHVFS